MERFTQEAFEQRSFQYGELLVLDDVLSLHASKSPSPVLFAYPREDRSGGYFETFTAAQLDGYVDAAVQHLIQSGHEPKLGRVVGLIGNANLEWVVNLFALSRLGYTVAMMSLVQKAVGLVSLLGSAGADAIIYDTEPGTSKLVAGITALQPRTVTTIPFVPRAVFSQPVTARAPRFFSRQEQTDTTALLFSTSGSTGLPRPIPYRHAHISLSTFTCATEARSTLLSWPLSHGWGLSILLGTLYLGATCHLMDTRSALTADSFIEALEAARPGFLPSVPHNVALIAHDPRGLACLRAAAYVTTGGARLPDELGTYLHEQGVNISSSMGSSEATRNFATSMYRPPGDPAWDYLEFPPILRRHILLDPVPANPPLHEVVLLPDFPGLSATAVNADDGSRRTGDIMQPHDTKPDAWKFMCRDGDFIALSTAGKVLGAPLEDRLQASPLVAAAVVVGVGRTVPGLLVMPAGEGEEAEEGFLEAVWKLVEEVNAVVPDSWEVGRDKIGVLPRTTRLPRTDKGNIMRQRVYTDFAREIDALYA
ncbi:NRPS-like enzyme, putative [Cordyceps militaris CM01]|uniref:NRPS-like enzyme, putative n=1 Tax=Cordyceps militaris (strain CM01) TaxID=983644 RepID=G3JSB6_CORMM|nr:NRPS-like enzyme, putative [Cordyceps militaris CM01]EGX88815.1 NRPS-like enzyme, putative [Cordyceps militaris CM01]